VLTDAEESQARELAHTTPLSLAQARQRIAERSAAAAQQRAVEDALDLATLRIVPNRADRRRAARERRNRR